MTSHSKTHYKTHTLQQLAEQRGHLLERIGQERRALQGQWTPVQQTLTKADHALAVLRSTQKYVQAHRKFFALVFSVAGVALVLLKPRRSFKMLKKGVVLWRGWRMLQSAQTFAPGTLWGSALQVIRRRFLTGRDSS